MTDKSDDLARKLAAAKDGDADALNELVDEFYDFVKSVATQETPPDVLRKTGASEIAQEAFLQMFVEIGTLRAKTRGEFAQWLKRVATNRSLDTIRRYRSGKRNVTRERDLEDSVHQNTRSDQETPSVAVSKAEAGQCVQNSIEQLPEHQREVLQLYFYGQLSLAAISRQLGLDHHVVTKLLKDGMKAIEKQLPDSFRPGDEPA